MAISSDSEPARRELSPADLRAAIDAAQHAAAYLRTQSVDQLLATIDRVILAWLQPHSSWQQRAQDVLPATTGFSRQMICHGLPLLLQPLRAEALGALLDDELGDHRVLDAPQRGRRALGPPLIAHVLSGNIPGLAATPIALSLAVKSATLIKSAAGDPIFADLFAASIHAVDEALARCLVVTHWEGGNAAMEAAAFASANIVVASGSDAAIATIAGRVVGRFIGHGHKVSFAAIGRECLGTAAMANDLAQRLAYDVSLWDQYGCLSPQLCYLEAGALIAPEEFARVLADALTRLANALPPRTLSLDEKAAVLRFRQATEWNSAHTLLTSADSTDWTISIERDADFLPSCLNRSIRLKAVRDLADLGAALAPHRRHLEAAGLAVGDERRDAITEMLAMHGVHRICPLGTMQTPTLAWRQSGRPRVAEWVEWTGVESRGA